MRRASLLLVVAGLFSCTFDIPDVVPDSGARQDSSVADAASDGIVFRDGTTDGPAATVYNDMGNPANWEIFDTSIATSPSVEAYSGGTFDGRYVYLAPTSGSPANSLVLQFDTTSSLGFGNKSSWTPFDTTATSSAAAGFFGATYDGTEFVYLTPFTTAASAMSAADGFVTRHDSRSSFTAGGSWSGFNATSLNSGAQGFAGEAFDGKYIYFAPNFAGSSTASGLVTRFDTTQGFGPQGAWSFFDALQLDPMASGFIGAVFDGRYVTFVPSFGTVALQYDKQGTFTDKAAWSVFDVSKLPGESSMIGFAGGVYDGQYVYLVPNWYFGTTAVFNSVVARYDPKLGFGMSAWTTFDVSTVNPMARGFAGGAFDGRYVYLVPFANDGSTTFTLDGLIVRYDTTKPFVDKLSWSSFDLVASLGGTVKGFFGAIFDGSYLYLVPYAYSTAARFHARTPGAMPALPAGGSFF